MNNTQLIHALNSENSSLRLKAALAIGSTPSAENLLSLIQHLRIESDFFVRDMLTWALTRFPQDEVFPLLVDLLSDDLPQARSQALHTLTKIKHPETWAHFPIDLIHDDSQDVRAAAWRVAIAYVPEKQREALAGSLLQELGRGDLELQRSLSRALLELGDVSYTQVMAINAHIQQVMDMMEDPDSGLAFHIDEAKRVAALGSFADNA